MKQWLLAVFILLLPITAMGGSLELQNSRTPELQNSSTPQLLNFVSEPQMQADLMEMLARFSTYMKQDYQECVAPNSDGEACGCFKGENTMANDERGVRPNADLSMVCAFLVKYGKGHVRLPHGVTWEDLEQMAMKSLVFAYSTHKANRLKTCKGDNYWGSTSDNDHVWESSLWAMSVAFSAFFQWDKLSYRQRQYIYQLLKAECNYELERTIPTGYAGDTKAEENGWEADVLAVTLGLFPDDPLAPRWFQRLREFAINSYSHPDDANDTTIIDPHYDRQTVKDLYKGQNLYSDYTLQNHNYFHTSYQNVVIQELGEAALAMKLFQQDLHGKEKWQTNALMHNNDRVMREVLYWLALSDGELAMPNGNDWSLFLYDQLTSYSTNACFLNDPHALMLENQAYKMIKARQATTDDGSWLLRPDVGARRMGVEAHRVMMTWLMHHQLSTASLSPTPWTVFQQEYSAAKLFSSQNIVRASTPDRFTCFSWSQGLQSYTGYIAPHPSPLTPTPSNLIVPFRQNNTGNFLGWYEVEGKKTNAKPVISGNYQLDGSAWTMNGELLTNDGTLDHRFAIFSTPGNAVILINNVRAREACTITKEKTGLMAISVDPFTSTSRKATGRRDSGIRLYFPNASNSIDSITTDGTTLSVPSVSSAFSVPPTTWVNIDNQFAVINTAGKNFAFGEKANNNSILTAKLYTTAFSVPSVSSAFSVTMTPGEMVDRQAWVYYVNTTANQTQELSQRVRQLQLPPQWNGIIAPDPQPSNYYMLLSNFGDADSTCILTDIRLPEGCPVFPVLTTIGKDGSTVSFNVKENHSATAILRFMVSEGSDVEAIQAKDDPDTIFLTNLVKGKNTLTLTVLHDQGKLSEKVTLSDKQVMVTIKDGRLTVRRVRAHNMY